MRNAVRVMLAFLVVLVCLDGTAGADDALEQEENALREAGVETKGPGLLEFIRRQTSTESDETRIGELITLMGHERFRLRERASAELASLGGRAVASLRTATAHKDLEIARRAERCLKEIERGAGEVLLVSALRLVATRKPAGAEAVLLDYLDSADRDYLIEAALDTLTALAVRDGKPAEKLTEALLSRQPSRRLAAGVALTRAGASQAREAVCRLLRDPSAHVRLNVGLALAGAGEKDAIPVLIELLEELPAAETGLVEDLLGKLAKGRLPQVPRGVTRAERKELKASWERWWQASGEKVDLTGLPEERLTGHTLVVALDVGKVIDLDAGKKVVWEIDGLVFPLDAQVLPGRRVLVSEYEAGRVSERNCKGEIVWEKKIDGPLTGQRLPNGNTFIATPVRLLEVDSTGKEVWTLPPPRNGRIMKATRLRNGDVALISQLGITKYFRIDRQGKELQEFEVEQRTAGGRVEVLPGGNVLIAERDAQRIAEYSPAGKVVWQARFEQPVSAVRLPNGNTLATGMNQMRAVELDPQGREVWEYRSDSRITRAWRY